MAEKLFRDARFERKSINVEQRTAQVAFASEQPCARFNEDEIIGLEDDEYDFDRLQDGGPLLLGHDDGQQVGVVEKVWVGTDKVARAVVRFSRSALGEEVFQDVCDGIRQKTSVGYEHTAELSRSNSKNGRQVVRYAWRAFEISLVAIPADDSVGVSRAEEVSARRHLQMKTTDNPNQLDDVAEIRGRTGAIKRDRPDLAEELDAARDRAIAEGWTLSQWTETVMRGVIKAKPPQEITLASLGCNEREAGSYSFARGIQSCVKRNATVPDGFEGEIDQAMRKRNLGFQAEGFLVPSDAGVSTRSISIADRRRLARDMQVNIFGQGGATVATELLTPIIEVLRKQVEPAPRSAIACRTRRQRCYPSPDRSGHRLCRVRNRGVHTEQSGVGSDRGIS